MPLFRSKKKYLAGDILVGTDALTFSWASAYLDIAVGPLTGLHLPSETPLKMEWLWTLRVYENGKNELLKLRDYYRFVVEPVQLEGVVSGKLDLDDPYEVKQYLKRCSRLLFPRYRDHLLDNGV
jgi:hypothetical protein